MFSGNVDIVGGYANGIRNWTNGDTAPTISAGDTTDQIFATFTLPVLEGMEIGWSTPPIGIADDATAGPVARQARLRVGGMYGAPAGTASITTVTDDGSGLVSFTFDTNVAQVRADPGLQVRVNAGSQWLNPTHTVITAADTIQCFYPGLNASPTLWRVANWYSQLVLWTFQPLNVGDNGSIPFP